jgi:hypothetical protein
MQTFNYLIRRFMLSRQAWQAQAIVRYLQTMEQEPIDQELCVDRLLPVWEMITETLMGHLMQTTETGSRFMFPVEYDYTGFIREVRYEA